MFILGSGTNKHCTVYFQFTVFICSAPQKCMYCTVNTVHIFNYHKSEVSVQNNQVLKVLKYWRNLCFGEI